MVLKLVGIKSKIPNQKCMPKHLIPDIKKGTKKLCYCNLKVAFFRQYWYLCHFIKDMNLLFSWAWKFEFWCLQIWQLRGLFGQGGHDGLAGTSLKLPKIHFLKLRTTSVLSEKKATFSWNYITSAWRGFFSKMYYTQSKTIWLVQIQKFVKILDS